MKNREAHLDILGAAYDAATEPDLWPGVLAQLCQLFNSAGVYTAVAQAATNNVLQSLTYNLPVDAVSEYDEHVIRIDPRVECMTGHPERAVFFDHLHTPESQMRCNPCYEWLRRVNGFSYYLGYRGFDNDGVVTFISLQRVRAQGHATEEQIRLFSELAPHLTRALRLTARLAQLSLGREAMEKVIDRLPCGVFILDNSARVLYCNAAAERTTAADDGLAMGVDGIRLASPAARRQYTSNFAIVAGKAGNVPIAPPSIICAARPSGKRPYVIWMAPIAGAVRSPFLQHATVIAIASDPESTSRLPRDILTSTYALTRREADVALQLADGLSLNEAAERLDICRDTARSYLKNIFRKVNVNRQSALVKLIWTIAIGLSEGNIIPLG